MGIIHGFACEAPKNQEAGVAMFRLFESGLFVVLVYLVVSLAAVFTTARAMTVQDYAVLQDQSSHVLHLS